MNMIFKHHIIMEMVHSNKPAEIYTMVETLVSTRMDIHRVRIRKIPLYFQPSLAFLGGFL